MELPSWVLDAIKEYEGPKTGRVVLELEYYQGGVTKIELGGFIRRKPLTLNASAGEYGVKRNEQH